MKNHIYRIRMSGSDGKTYFLELSIFETNDTQTGIEILEIGAQMTIGDVQLDGSLDESELDSLYNYVSECMRYISAFNKNIKPKSEE